MNRLIFLLLFSFPIHGMQNMYDELQCFLEEKVGAIVGLPPVENLVQRVTIEGFIIERTREVFANPSKYKFFLLDYDLQEEQELHEAAVELYLRSLLTKYRRLQRNSK